MGADMNGEDGSWYPSCYAGDRRVVEMLLSEFPNFVREKNEDGSTPLCVLAGGGNVDLIKMVLAVCPACINDVDGRGFTPVLCFFDRGIHMGNEGEDLITYLQERFPESLCCKTPEKENGLHLAARQGRIDEVEQLLRHLPINDQDSLGFTPLAHAAFWGNLSMIRYLLACGARADIVTNFLEYTAEDLAKAEHNDDAARCLEQCRLMTEEEKSSNVTNYGWEYVELRAWALHIHPKFPAQFRAQVHAVAVSLGHSEKTPHTAPVLCNIAKAMDARNRGLDFKI